jgi:hypothetical protein
MSEYYRCHRFNIVLTGHRSDTFKAMMAHEPDWEVKRAYLRVVDALVSKVLVCPENDQAFNLLCILSDDLRLPAKATKDSARLVRKLSASLFQRMQRAFSDTDHPSCNIHSLQLLVLAFGIDVHESFDQEVWEEEECYAVATDYEIESLLSVSGKGQVEEDLEEEEAHWHLECE